MDTPDLAGFREARERKRAAFSEPVVLLGAVEAVYPGGTPTRADGTPFDPTIDPVSSGRASAVIDAEFVWSSSQDPADHVAIGIADKARPMLIASSGASAALEGKTHFQARGNEFKIEATHFDGITGVDRILIYGART